MIGEVSIIATDHDMKVIYVIYIYIYLSYFIIKIFMGGKEPSISYT